MPPQQLDLGIGEPELRVRDGRGEGGRHLEGNGWNFVGGEVTLLRIVDREVLVAWFEGRTEVVVEDVEMGVYRDTQPGRGGSKHHAFGKRGL